MAIFLTGSTGYIGAHVLANLLENSSENVNLLIRARDANEARERLWRAIQIHIDFPRFRELLDQRIAFFRGDLTGAKFGLEDDDYQRLVKTTDSVVHCAASLNRKSEKACLNVNLRGTLQVIELASRAHTDHGLRRFSHVSTVAVAGMRSNEVVREDTAIDWDRSDYDPYARTKKFCEHMGRELLPDVSKLFLRPSIVLGDSRRAETTQFDMVRAFVFLAGLPVLPFRPGDRLDIVPVDYVADAISTLHLKEKPLHEIYHLSSGTDAETFQQLTEALASAQGKRGPMFMPGLEKSSTRMINSLARRSGKVSAVLFVDLAVGVSRTLPLDRVSAIKDRLTRAVRAELPHAEVTITTEPRALDDETVRERVMMIARNRGLAIHHVAVQAIAGRLAISVDLEVEGAMALNAAHEVASGLEEAMREELGPDVEVETHIEPLPADVLPGRDASAARIAEVREALSALAAEIAALGEVHDVRVRETRDGEIVNFHCQVDPALSVGAVHDMVDALERRLRRRFPTIQRVIGHAEPRQ